MPTLSLDQAKNLLRSMKAPLLGVDDSSSSLLPQSTYSSGIPSSLGRAVAPTLLPIKGRITQEFGVPQAVKAAGERIHAGVDIAAPLGTPIPDVAGGVVLKVEDFGKRGYGKSVTIKGADGRIRRYSHLSQFGVKEGQRVNKGDIIGLVGSTGVSTGSHLDMREYLPN